MKRSRPKRGRFVTLEGVEGVGKSTQLRSVCQRLREHGLHVVETREPGGTPEADEIRATLLKVRGDGFDPMAELLMMFAARALHVEKVIRPALAAGSWVVCDRFTDASYAYQGGGRGIPTAQIVALERLVLKGLKPDLTVLLDVDPAVGIARARGRGTLDRFEQEQDAFFKKVRRVYLARARKEPRRIRVIDASQDVYAVQRDVSALMDLVLRRWT